MKKSIMEGQTETTLLRVEERWCFFDKEAKLPPVGAKVIIQWKLDNMHICDKMPSSCKIMRILSNTGDDSHWDIFYNFDESGKAILDIKYCPWCGKIFDAY